MLNKTIAIYAIIDDLLKAIGHDEDVRIKMSDAEIITGRTDCSDIFRWQSQQGLRLYERPQLSANNVRKITF